MNTYTINLNHIAIWISLIITAGSAYSFAQEAPPALLQFVDPRQLDLSPAQNQILQKTKREASASAVQLVKIDPALLDSDKVNINIGSGDTVVLEKQSSQGSKEDSMRSYTFSAAGGKTSAQFFIADKVRQGTIRTDKSIHNIRPLSANLLLLISRDISKLPEEHPKQFEQNQQKSLTEGGEEKAPANPAPANPAPANPAPANPAPANPAPANPGQQDAAPAAHLPTTPAGGQQAPASDTSLQDAAAVPSTVDVLVLYTSGVSSKYPNVQADFLTPLFFNSNATFERSKVRLRLNLVHAEKATYQETGDLARDVERLLGTSDGHLDNIHALRNQHKADIAVLIVERGDALGYAAAIKAQEHNAFAVVVDETADWYFSFIHEVGHLLGARHNHEHDNTEDPPYAHGFRHPAGKWRCIMSYDCDDGCSRVGIWSSPLVRYDNTTAGNDHRSNNARVLNENAGSVASFR